MTGRRLLQNERIGNPGKGLCPVGPYRRLKKVCNSDYMYTIVDLKKAYDKVGRKEQWSTLSGYEVDGCPVQALVFFYECGGFYEVQDWFIKWEL